MTDIALPVGATAAEAEHQAHLRRAVVASTVGTTIEWYDFLIYSTMTGLVFGRVFFAGSDPLIDTLKAFGVFFIGFVARPIGAAIFGHYGDRIGRKATLIVTLLMTGLATAAVGLVPGYDMIGIWGAVILTLLRLIQGIGVGGEWAARSCWRWSGRAATRIAGSLPPGRNLVLQPGCFWRTWQC